MSNFSALDAYLDSLHRDKGAPGCEVIVSRGHELLHRHAAGFSDEGKTCPMSPDTLVYLYSCTKPITVSAVMQQVERGRLDLEDPVSRYLPEYADAFLEEDGRRRPVGRPITIRHLLTMSAGLTYDLGTPAIQAAKEKYGSAATTRQIVSAFVQSPLSFEPGTRFQYSLCHDVLAAVVEVVSGQRYGDYLREHIFVPLGMNDTGFTPTAEQYSRIAAQYDVRGEDHHLCSIERSIDGFRVTENYESGGAGLFSSAEDYSRFARAMACGGESDGGARILRPETVDLLRTPQMGAFVMNNNFSCAAGAGYNYGLGVRVLVSRDQGQRSHLGEFGWDGAAASYILMDPDVQVSVVFVQHTRGWPARFGCMHAPVRDLAYEALGL